MHRTQFSDHWWSSDVRFSPDGNLLAYVESPSTPSLQSQPSVVVWDLASRKTVVTLDGEAGPVAFSPDGATLATTRFIAEKKEYAVRLWEPRSGKAIATIGGLDRAPLQVEFSTDGRYVAAYAQNLVPSSGGELLLCSTQTRTAVRHWRDVHHFAFACDEPIICLHYAPVSRTNYVDHWRLPAASEAEPELIRRIDRPSTYSPTGRYRIESHVDTWTPHPVRRWVVEGLLGSREPPESHTTTIRFMDYQGGIWYVEADGWVTAQLSPDEKTLLVFHTGGRVELYDVPPKQPVAALAMFSALASLLFTSVLWWRLAR
jgi:hypothetical protein